VHPERKIKCLQQRQRPLALFCFLSSLTQRGVGYKPDSANGRAEVDRVSGSGLGSGSSGSGSG
jgi:hypothetical protein